MFILLQIEDKLLLNPLDLNPNSSLPLTNQTVPLPSIHNPEPSPESREEKQKVPLPYNDIIYKKLRKKYISKILLGYGIVVSIQKFNIKSNLIVEIEGVINVEVYYDFILYCVLV